MNAQEALSRLTDIALTREWGAEEEIIRCNDIIKKALDQSNAKSKTLEELGWEKDIELKSLTIYENKKTESYRSLTFHKKHNYISSFDYNENGIVNPASFTYEEILAIAEKMKELGMTNE